MWEIAVEFQLGSWVVFLRGCGCRSFAEPSGLAPDRLCRMGQDDNGGEKAEGMPDEGCQAWLPLFCHPRRLLAGINLKKAKMDSRLLTSGMTDEGDSCLRPQE